MYLNVVELTICIINRHHTKSSRAVEQWLVKRKRKKKTTKPLTITYGLERVCVEHILWFQRCQFSVLSFPEAVSPGGEGAVRPEWQQCPPMAPSSMRKDVCPRASRQGPVYSISSGRLGLVDNICAKMRFSPFSKKPVSGPPV